MARQLTFDLPVRAALGRGDFFVSPSNAVALAALDAPDWTPGKLLLVGPEASGKTHLVHVWAEQTGAEVLDAAHLTSENALDAAAVAIEDVDGIAGDRAKEEALFHLHNHLMSTGRKLLMTGTGVPEAWGFALPDLASRVAGSPRAELQAPDDDLLAALMMKQFADRQLQVAPDVLTYLVGRMDRSFDAARRLVRALDAEALAAGRAVTRPLAAKVLDNQGSASP